MHLRITVHASGKAFTEAEVKVEQQRLSDMKKPALENINLDWDNYNIVENVFFYFLV